MGIEAKSTIHVMTQKWENFPINQTTRFIFDNENERGGTVLIATNICDFTFLSLSTGPRQRFYKKLLTISFGFRREYNRPPTIKKIAKLLGLIEEMHQAEIRAYNKEKYGSEYP